MQGWFGAGGGRGAGAGLLNTAATMRRINGDGRHVKVIELPSSIMNGTINKAGALPFVRRLNGRQAL